MRLLPVRLVTQWSVEQMLWSRRTLAMVPLAAAPVALALVYRAAVALEAARPAAAAAVFAGLTATAGLKLAAPLLALVYATGVVADDREAGTLAYFLTRPLLRSEFLAGKMLASLGLALLLYLPALVLTYYLVLAPAGIEQVGTHFPLLLRSFGAALLGIGAYNGLFALAGTALRRPLLSGLFFLFGWQAAAAVVPGAMRYLTVSHYLDALRPQEILGSGFAAIAGGSVSPGTAVLALLGIAAGAHAAAIACFRRQEL